MFLTSQHLLEYDLNDWGVIGYFICGICCPMIVIMLLRNFPEELQLNCKYLYCLIIPATFTSLCLIDMFDNIVTFRKQDATITFPTFEGRTSGDIRFQFKTTQMNGILLQNTGNFHFIEVKLVCKCLKICVQLISVLSF